MAVRAVLVLATIMTCLNAATAFAIEHKGICDNGPAKLVELAPEALSARVDAFRSLGVKWLRFDFDWSQIEPAPGTYRVSGYDAAVTALVGAGINVLGIIDYTPSWANGGKSSKFHPPSDPGEYGKFAGYLAARYAPMGVHTWEIWNEENVGQFWAPSPDVAAYARLLRAAFEAIHKEDPGTTVIAGGLAQPGNSATSIAALDFLRGLYANGARRYFDALADHPYSSPRLPRDPSPSNNWQRMFATTPSLRTIMRANDDADKRIWITEYGAPTAGISSYDQRIVISEADQAEMLKQAYEMVAQFPWAGPLFWYQYQDVCPLPGKSSECHYGLTRFDGSMKPGYAQFRAASD